MTIAPPIPYFGGKQKVGPRIASLFPPHGHYVEPYAGSLAVLFSKPHEMLDEPEHRELAQALRQCNATVLLSGYPSALYDELYEGWSRVEFPTGTGQSARGEWSERTEVVWANVPLRRDGHLW